MNDKSNISTDKTSSVSIRELKKLMTELINRDEAIAQLIRRKGPKNVITQRSRVQALHTTSQLS